MSIPSSQARTVAVIVHTSLPGQDSGCYRPYLPSQARTVAVSVLLTSIPIFQARPLFVIVHTSILGKDSGCYRLYLPPRPGQRLLSSIPPSQVRTVAAVIVHTSLPEQNSGCYRPVTFHTFLPGQDSGCYRPYIPPRTEQLPLTSMVLYFVFVGPLSLSLPTTGSPDSLLSLLLSIGIHYSVYCTVHILYLIIYLFSNQLEKARLYHSLNVTITFTNNSFS